MRLSPYPGKSAFDAAKKPPAARCPAFRVAPCGYEMYRRCFFSAASSFRPNLPVRADATCNAWSGTCNTWSCA
jgi:hypothetical protein